MNLFDSQSSFPCLDEHVEISFHLVRDIISSNYIRFNLLFLISRLTMFFMFLIIKLMFTLNPSYHLNLFFYNPSWILYLTHSTFQGSIEAIWSNIILETGPIMCCIISLVSIIFESFRESQLKLVAVRARVFTLTCTKLLFEKNTRQQLQDYSSSISSLSLSQTNFSFLPN